MDVYIFENLTVFRLEDWTCDAQPADLHNDERRENETENSFERSRSCISLLG